MKRRKQIIIIKMKTLCILAIFLTLSIVVSSQTTDKPMPEPVDFHAPFAYSTCGTAFKDIFKQITLIYGDLYGSIGLNTAFFRLWQFVLIQLPAFWHVCF